MDNLEEKTSEEKLDWYRGKIMSSSIEIEKALGWKLRTYFFPKTNIQAALFYQVILNANFFNFDRKIRLYNQISYFRKLKNFKEITDSLRFVQKVRNELAHWELLSDGENNKDEVIIYSPISFKKRKLNKKLMADFTVHDKRLLKFFGWNYELERKYAIKNKNIFNSRTIEIREYARLLSNYTKLK